MDNLLTTFNRNWIPVRQFDELFNDLFGASARGWTETPTSIAPPAEVDETESHFLVSLDVPGVPKENIQIEARDGRLRVTAERKEPVSSKAGERRFGKWERYFSLPKEVDIERVEASCEDGVLRIAIPKAEAAKPRFIKIQEGKAGFFQKLLSPGKRDGGSPDVSVDTQRSA